jgi:hypothetical protein
MFSIDSVKPDYNFYMSNLNHIVIILLLLLPVSVVRAGLLDKGYTVEYEVSKNEMYLGIARRSMMRDAAGNVELKSHTIPKGIVSLFFSDQVTETSHLKMKQDLLIPQVYTYHQTGGKEEKFYKLEFDWKNNLLLSTYDNKQHSIKPGTQELFGFQVQLMMDLLRGKKSVTYDIASRKGVETYKIKITGQEEVETDLGKYMTLKLESDVTSRGRKYIFWCDKNMSYLPVKVQRIESDGDEIVLLLKKLIH